MAKGWRFDSKRHSLASRGIKSPQRCNLRPFKQNNLQEIFSGLKEISIKYHQIWVDEEKGKITREERDLRFKKLNNEVGIKQIDLFKRLFNHREQLKVPVKFNYEDYPIVNNIYTGDSNNGRIVMMTPDEYLRLVALFQTNDDGTKSSTVSWRVIKELIPKVKKSGKINVGYLDIEHGKVISQEGRHNAVISKIFGIEKIPVGIFGEFWDFDVNTTKPQYD